MHDTSPSVSPSISPSIPMSIETSIPTPITPTTPIDRLVRRQHGTVSGAQLRAHDLRQEHVETLRDRGLVVAIGPDLYRLSRWPHTFEARCVAATLTDPGVVVAGAAAALLWDFDHVYRPTHPDVIVRSDDHAVEPLRVPHATIRIARGLDDRDVVSRGDAIRVTSRARTWYDCVGQTSIERGTQFTAHVLDSHCDPPELWDVVNRVEATRRGPKGRAFVVLDQLTDRERSIA